MVQFIRKNLDLEGMVGLISDFFHPLIRLTTHPYVLFDNSGHIDFLQSIKSILFNSE